MLFCAKGWGVASNSERAFNINTCLPPQGMERQYLRDRLGLVQPSGRPAELVSKHFVCFGFALSILKDFFHYAKHLESYPRLT